MAAPFTISANLQINPASITASAGQVKQALGRITGQASEFQKSLDASTARVFAFGATTSVIQGINQSMKTLVSTTIEVQKRMIEIQAIFQQSDQVMNQFRNTIFNVAKNTGQAFGTVADAAGELARQGLSAEETANRLEAALVLTRISGQSAEQSVKTLTAAINGFTSAGLNAAQITNKIVAVDTAFAVSADDLSAALSRAGSTAEDAGVSFDELLGLVTAVEQRTARGGAVIGNAFKSIFTRLSRGSIIDDLKGLGVEIDASQSGIQKLQALSNAIEGISDPTVVSQIKELAGGVYQINVVSSTLKDLSSDTSIFAAATKEAANATNEAYSRNAELNKSAASQINALIQSVTSLGERIGSLTFGPLLESLVGIATKLATALDSALDPEKGNKFIQGIFKTIGGFISGPGLVLITTAFLKITQMVSKFAVEGFKSIMQMGSAQESVKQIEAGIVDLLAKDKQLRTDLANAALTQAQKEQAIIAAIQRENQLLTQQEQILRNIANLAAQKGVTGYDPSQGFSGKGGRRFATGFKQEEATARMLGASSKVKAHYGKGTIGGKRFIMNNQETEIPNFGRNGDSAVIPHYARGFVPNYANVDPYIFKDNRWVRNPNYRGKYPQIPLAYKQHNEAEIQKGYQRKQQDKQAKQQEIKESGLPTLIPFSQLVQGQLPTILTPTGGGDNITYKPYLTTLGFNAPQGIQTEMTFPSASIDPSGKLGLRKSFENRYSADRVEEFAKNVAIKEAQRINRNLDPKGQVNPKSIEEIDKVKGFVEAVKGAFGGVFDAAVTTLIGMPKASIFAGKDKGGDFDVRGSSPILEQLFGNVLPTSGKFTGLGDFKFSAANAGKSMASKVAAEARGEIGASLAAMMGKSSTSKTLKKASGYIPNFNSMNKGVPVSQIRAHFDENGNPIAVTNTRDEPNGLKDAIGREKKGIGMYAKGFVPNFAQPNTGSSGMGSLIQYAVFNQALQKLAEKAGEERSLREQKINELQSAYDKEIATISDPALIAAKQEELETAKKSINSQTTFIETIDKASPILNALIGTYIMSKDAISGMLPSSTSFKDILNKVNIQFKGLKIGGLGMAIKNLRGSMANFGKGIGRGNLAMIAIGEAMVIADQIRELYKLGQDLINTLKNTKNTNARTDIRNQALNAQKDIMSQYGLDSLAGLDRFQTDQIQPYLENLAKAADSGSIEDVNKAAAELSNVFNIMMTQSDADRQSIKDKFDNLGRTINEFSLKIQINSAEYANNLAKIASAQFDLENAYKNAAADIDRLKGAIPESLKKSFGVMVENRSAQANFNQTRLASMNNINNAQSAEALAKSQFQTAFLANDQKGMDEAQKAINDAIQNRKEAEQEMSEAIKEETMRLMNVLSELGSNIREHGGKQVGDAFDTYNNAVQEHANLTRQNITLTGAALNEYENKVRSSANNVQSAFNEYQNAVKSAAMRMRQEQNIDFIAQNYGSNALNVKDTINTAKGFKGMATDTFEQRQTKNEIMATQLKPMLDKMTTLFGDKGKEIVAAQAGYGSGQKGVDALMQDLQSGMRAVFEEMAGGNKILADTLQKAYEEQQQQKEKDFTNEQEQLVTAYKDTISRLENFRKAFPEGNQMADAVEKMRKALDDGSSVPESFQSGLEVVNQYMNTAKSVVENSSKTITDLTVTNVELGNSIVTLRATIESLRAQMDDLKTKVISLENIGTN